MGSQPFNVRPANPARFEASGIMDGLLAVDYRIRLRVTNLSTTDSLRIDSVAIELKSGDDPLGIISEALSDSGAPANASVSGAGAIPSLRRAFLPSTGAHQKRD